MITSLLTLGRLFFKDSSSFLSSPLLIRVLITSDFATNKRNKLIIFLRQYPILRSMSDCSDSFKINTSSSIESTSNSMALINGANVSMMSSNRP